MRDGLQKCEWAIIASVRINHLLTMSILRRNRSLVRGLTDMEQSLHHRIRERAYEMWNGGGRIDGQADQHWLTAEREVLAEMTAPTSAAKTVASHISRRHTRDRANIESHRKRRAKAS